MRISDKKSLMAWEFEDQKRTRRSRSMHCVGNTQFRSMPGEMFICATLCTLYAFRALYILGKLLTFSLIKRCVEA